MSTKSVTTLPESLVSASQALKSVAQTTTPAAVYTFTLDSFRITNTRALHNDTDYVCTAVVVGQNPPITSAVQYMGNVDNGTHEVNLSIPNVPVGPNDHSAFTYSIVNCGHGSRDQIESALEKATAAAAAKLAQEWTAQAPTKSPAAAPIRKVGAGAFGWLAGKIEGIIFADCDGVVAGGDCIFFPGEEALITQNGRVATFGPDSCPGTNSPVGCGSNSQYYVTWSVSAGPPAPTGGGSSIGGRAGGVGPTGGNPPHRLD